MHIVLNKELFSHASDLNKKLVDERDMPLHYQARFRKYLLSLNYYPI